MDRHMDERGNDNKYRIWPYMYMMEHNEIHVVLVNDSFQGFHTFEMFSQPITN